MAVISGQDVKNDIIMVTFENDISQRQGVGVDYST